MFTSSALAAWIALITPPAKYDHAFNGQVHISSSSPSMHWSGTAQRIGKHCYVKINPRYPQYRDLLIRHEIAHCNGWPQSHPH